MSIDLRDHSISPSFSVQDLIGPRFTGAKLAVPLQSGSPYISFKHVQGVPGGEGGVSASRLRNLEALISRLASMKKLDNMTPEVDLDGMSDAAVDALIRNLREEFSLAVRSDSMSRLSSGFGMAGSATAVTVDMSA